MNSYREIEPQQFCYRFFKDKWKQLKKFTLNFSSCNPFRVHFLTKITQ